MGRKPRASPVGAIWQGDLDRHCQTVERARDSVLPAAPCWPSSAGATPAAGSGRGGEGAGGPAPQGSSGARAWSGVGASCAGHGPARAEGPGGSPAASPCLAGPLPGRAVSLSRSFHETHGVLPPREQSRAHAGEPGEPAGGRRGPRARASPRSPREGGPPRRPGRGWARPGLPGIRLPRQLTAESR